MNRQGFLSGPWGKQLGAVDPLLVSPFLPFKVTAILNANHKDGDPTFPSSTVMSDDDRASFTSIQSLHASPDSITSKPPEFLDQPQSRLQCIELVTRIRAMTMELLPVEVNTASINEPTSRVITPQVISTYIAAAGDFHEAVRGSPLGPLQILTFGSFRMLFYAHGATS